MSSTPKTPNARSRLVAMTLAWVGLFGIIVAGGVFLASGLAMQRAFLMEALSQ